MWPVPAGAVGVEGAGWPQALPGVVDSGGAGVTEVLTTFQELERDRRRMNEATTELYRVTEQLHGGTTVNDDGEPVYTPGVADRYQEVTDNELIALEEGYLSRDQRLPAADIRTARVTRAVRQKHPELHAQYLALEAQEKALTRAISGRKAAIGAAQSILRGERG